MIKIRRREGEKSGLTWGVWRGGRRFLQRDGELSIQLFKADLENTVDAGREIV